MKGAATLTLAAFKDVQQSRFHVRLDATAGIELSLVEAHAFGPGSGDQEVRSFSLLFEGPRDPLLPQRIYRFEHDSMGAFDLFIVPVEQSQEHCRYEAVFNLAPAVR